MKRALIELIDRVRELKLRVDIANNIETIKIGGSSGEFPARLIALQKALQAYEQSEEESEDHIQVGDFVIEKTATPLVIGALISILQKNGSLGTSPEGILDVVKSMIQQGDKKGTASFVYKPASKKKKRTKEFDRSSVPKIMEGETIDSLQKKGFQAQMSVQGLGPALAADREYKERARKRAEIALERENEARTDADTSPEIEPKNDLKT